MKRAVATTELKAKRPARQAPPQEGIQPAHWFFFTVLFSYVPLGAKLLFSLLFAVKVSVADCIGEILFASIVISAETLHTMFEGRSAPKEGKAEQTLWLTVLVFSILIILFAAMIYGGMIIQPHINEKPAWGIALGFSVSSFALGLLAQLPTRKETEHNE